jgi:signal transduction histidine kinase/ligand-binding sensor domain-containing protein/DNA-binding response OmpR family regulator
MENTNYFSWADLKQAYLCSTVLALLLIFSNTVWGKSVSRSYTSADGLSSNIVKAICQDNEGYLWIGTKNGMNRYDGYDITSYFQTPTKEISQPNDITSIVKMHNGLFWIGTFNGIVIFDPYQKKYFNSYNLYKGAIPKSVVVGICETKNGDVYVATKKGLYLYSHNECTTIKYFSNRYINAMNMVNNRYILMDIVNLGLVSYDIRTKRPTMLINPKNRYPFYKIYKDADNDYWIVGSLNDIFKYTSKFHRIEKIRCHADNVFTDGNFAHDILDYDRNTLVFATDDGIVLFDKKTNTLSKDKKINLNFRIMSIYKDKQGALWMGTFGQGIYYYHPQLNKFSFYAFGDNMVSPVFGALTEYKGKIWVGYNNGFNVFDTKSKTFSQRLNINSDDETANPIFYIKKSEGNTAYIYLLNKGIYSVNLDSKSKERIFPELSKDLQIRAITKDADSRYWFAEDKLSFLDHGKYNDNLSTNKNGTTLFMLTQDIIRHRKDMIVGLRTNGVWIFKYDTRQKQHYYQGQRLPFKELYNKNISLLYEDRQGNIWIGTFHNGLYKCNLKRNVIKSYNTSNGLLNNSIRGIEQDKYFNDIWVASASGLSQIKQNGRIMNYSNKNGFPIADIQYKSIINASDGNIYIAGSDGMTCFNPKEMQYKNSFRPNVKLSLLETLNDQSSQEHIRITDFCNNKTVKLFFENATFRIKFSVLDYLNANGYHYAYKMDNLDSKWEYTDDNEVVFSNLPSGTYTFMVKACNNAGEWSKSVTELTIYVNPPVWLSWWAKTLYTIFVLAFIFVILSYYYMKKTAKHKAEIERLEKENIEKNYKMKMELFTNFSHDLRTPLTLITGPIADMCEDDTLPEKFMFPAQLIQKNANRLLLLVNQFLDLRKIEHGTMQLKITNIHTDYFVNEQIESFTGLLKKNHLNIIFANHYTGNDWWADADLMGNVFYNLISNAVKYAFKDTTIRINCDEENGHIVFSIINIGKKISQEDLSKIFNPFYQVRQGIQQEMFGSGLGLSFVQYIIKLHSGDISVECSDDGEITFTVKMKLGYEHYENAEKVVYTEIEKVQTDVVQKSMMTLNSDTEKDSSEIDDNKPQILLVEDNDDMRHYIVSKLAPTYHVYEANDGEQGLELAIKYIPDLIISDVMMPVMDGIELCQKVKSTMEVAHIPVVLLTAKILEEHIETGYKALADDYILKPFNAHILLIKIESIIKNRDRLKRLFANNLQAIDKPIENVTEQNPFMEKLVDLIRANASNSDLSINMLYDEMGMSRAQFFRKIKSVSDLSPNKLILNIRMKLAVEKLNQHKYSISEVAYDVGFSDPAYFSKVFKSFYDITPTDYIKGTA